MGNLPIDNAIARWCCDKDQIAGAGTDTLPSVPTIASDHGYLNKF